MIKALIVDDELAPREVLKDLIANFCPGVSLVGVAKDSFEADELIQKYQPDLVFLDVEMPKRTGIQFLESLRNVDFDVIFTTAFDKYAVQAIKLSALDYLVKPIDIKELIQAVHRVKENQKDTSRIHNLLQNAQQEIKKMALGHKGGVEFIPIDNILYCQADGSYTHFVIEGMSTIVVGKTLKNYEDVLLGEGFYRCHKSYIVNLKSIVRLDKEGYLNLTDGAKIQVTKSKKEELIRLITNV